jgi:Spy/CpxP family protein refolding chaperone
MRTTLKKKAGKGVMVMLAAVSLVIVGIGSASAGRQGVGHGWQQGDMGRQQHRCALGIWQNPKMVKELELTDDQVAKLKDSYFTVKEKRLALQSQLDGYRLEMQKAFSAETPDESTVRQIAGKIADAKGDLFVQKVESRLMVAKILNAGQIEKLRERSMRHRNKRDHGDKQYGQHQEKGHGQGRRVSDAGNCLYSTKKE